MKHDSIANRAIASAMLAGFDEPEIDKAICAQFIRMKRFYGSSVVEYIPTPFTHEWLLSIHKYLVKPQKGLALTERGFYRSRTKKNIAQIDGQPARLPDHTKVLGLVSDWLQKAEHMSPKDAFVAFERIHPFTDANGRVGRFIYQWIEWRQKIKPLFVFSLDNKAEVDAWFVDADNT